MIDLRCTEFQSNDQSSADTLEKINKSTRRGSRLFVSADLPLQ